MSEQGYDTKEQDGRAEFRDGGAAHHWGPGQWRTIDDLWRTGVLDGLPEGRKRDHASVAAPRIFLPVMGALLFLGVSSLRGQQPRTEPVSVVTSQRADSAYILGPGDQISVHVVNFEDISDKPTAIDLIGSVRLPVIGSTRAAGLTTAQLEAELARRLETYLLKPDVSVAIAEFRSQPVSLVGAVKNPGVQQVQGRKTLVEVLSQAGGVDAMTAGSELRLTRLLEWGMIPLPGATKDPTGKFSIARISLKSLFDSTHPEQNIPIKPDDVISIPRADTIYVIGNVQKSGGFLLNDHPDVTVLQALSMAGGLDKLASPKRARILRMKPGASARSEIPVNLNQILEGKLADVRMQADDILFVPNNAPKNAAVRALDAAIQMGTGVVVWGRF